MQDRDFTKIKLTELKKRNLKISSLSIKIFGDLRIRAFRVAWVFGELLLPWTLEETFP